MSSTDKPTQYTAGPWGVPDGGMRPMVCSAHAVVATLADTGDEFEANARLIAAAPDLLAALRALLKVCDAELDAKRVPEMRAARAAIARATEG